jgi:hypothetical protein
MGESNPRTNRDRYTLHEPVGPANPAPAEETWRVCGVAGPHGPYDQTEELARVRSVVEGMIDDAKREATAIREEAVREMRAARDAALRSIREAADLAAKPGA